MIHARIIDETGGLHGVRDPHLLSSMSERPKMSFAGKDLYEGMFQKTAAYFESCAYHHVFMDGNKRTALAIAERFLFINGWELCVSNREVEKFILDAVVGTFDLKTIAEWFKKYAKKIKRK